MTSEFDPIVSPLQIRAPLATTIVAVAGGTAQRLQLDGPTVLKIGRLRTAQIFLEAERVSRLHCVAEVSKDRVFIFDLGGMAGTFVNGKRINKSEWHVGAILQIGSATLYAVHTLEGPEPSDEEAACIRAICEAPRDPAARLVYADWLLDRSDTSLRANVIQRAHDPKIIASLIAEHAYALSAPLPISVHDWRFVGGLVGAVRLEVGELDSAEGLKKFARLRRAHPIFAISIVNTGATAGAIERLASTNAFDGIERLELTGVPITPRDAEALAGSGVARSLKAIVIDPATVERDALCVLRDRFGTTALEAAPWFPVPA